MLTRYALPALGLMLALVAGCSSPPTASSAGPTPLVKTFSKDSGGGALGGSALPPEGGMVLVGDTTEMVATAARALNMDEQSLRSAWSARSLAEIAREHGVEPATLVEQLTTAEHERLLKEAAAGRVAPNDVRALRDSFAQGISLLIQHPLAASPGG